MKKVYIIIISSLCLLTLSGCSTKQKLSMGDTDIFYFIPQYIGANDILIKFFGITKDGNAFEFTLLPQ